MSVAQQELEQPVKGLAVATPEDRASLDDKLRREREWYGDAQHFITEDDIILGVANGTLRELHNSRTLRRIGRFERGIEGFSPFLTDRAWRAVHDLFDLWAEKRYMNGGNTDTMLRAAVTSMTRSEVYNDRLVADPTKLASPNSTHMTGNAFDIDVSGYYLIGAEGAISFADPRRAQGRLAVSAQLEGRYGALEFPTKMGDGYNPHLTAMITVAAREMYEDGAINLIEEFSGTENACLHVAVNPDY